MTMLFVINSIYFVILPTKIGDKILKEYGIDMTMSMGEELKRERERKSWFCAGN